MFELWQPDANTSEKKKGANRNMTKLTAGIERRIKRKLSEEKPTIWVGKNGVSEELVEEIEKQLKKREMVKIKILKSALEEYKAKQIASRTAEQTEAILIEVKGHTFMLYKRAKK